MNPSDLADSGSRLASLDVSKRPREADLRRAVTSSYSACVHALCLTVANLMIGATRAARDTEAWLQAYKAMEHGRARAICSNKELLRNSITNTFGKNESGTSAAIPSFFIAKQTNSDRRSSALLMRDEFRNMCGCSPVCKSFFATFRARRIVRTCVRPLHATHLGRGPLWCTWLRVQISPKDSLWSAVGTWFSRSRSCDRLTHKWSQNSPIFADEDALGEFRSS